MPNSEYTLNINIVSKDRTSKPAAAANSKLASLKKTVKTLAAAYAVLKVAQGAVEFVKFGARVGRAETALNNLAKEAGTSGDAIVKSIQEASGFTVDRMSAMEAANKALLLEVVKTPEEFAALTKNAVLLGRAMGEDAATSIDKFTRAAGRQSKLIADDLGLKVDLVKVQEETNRLMAEDASLTTDSAKAKAFFNVMMAEATRKTAALGDETRSLATDMEIIDAAVKDAKADWAIIAGNYVSGGEGADGLAEKIRGLATTWTQVSLIGRAASAGISEMFTGMFDPGTTGIERFSQGWKDAWQEFLDGFGDPPPDILPDISGSMMKWGDAADDAATATREWDTSTEDLFTDMANNAPSILGKYADSAKWLTERLAEQREETDRLADATRQFAMDAAADFTSFAKLQAKDAADLAEDKESIEQEHQDKLAAIQKKALPQAIKFNALAEQEKLDRLKERLTVALQKQGEFNDKTRQSVRTAKEFQIANLQEEIAAKEQMFENFEAGRLVKAGMNITGLLAQEEARFAEEKRLLEESRLEQELAQKESLGRMVLANFTAWAEINGVAQDEIFKTQLFIQEKYGLITKEGEAMALAMVDDFELIKEVGIEAFKLIKEEQDKIARHIALTFSVREVGRAAAEEAAGGRSVIPGLDAPGFAHGGTAPGGSMMVGELGTEMVSPPAGSRVTPASQVTNNYKFEQVVHTRATTHSITDDFALAEAMAG